MNIIKIYVAYNKKNRIYFNHLLFIINIFFFFFFYFRFMFGLLFGGIGSEIGGFLYLFIFFEIVAIILFLLFRKWIPYKIHHEIIKSNTT